MSHMSPPEIFRRKLHVFERADLTRHEIILELQSLYSEATLELGKANRAKKNWESDYWRGNVRRVKQALDRVKTAQITPPTHPNK